jgi:lipid-binding SYLF domain-containing protein
LGPIGRFFASVSSCRGAFFNKLLKLNAEILSYSRSKGVFAGVSVDGAVVQADHSGDQAMYGSNVTRREILDRKIAVPQPARRLLAELAKYPAHR